MKDFGSTAINRSTDIKLSDLNFSNESDLFLEFEGTKKRNAVTIVRSPAGKLVGPELIRYFEKAGNFDLLTSQEEIELARRRDLGDGDAAKRLVVSNLRLVVKFAKRYLNRGLDFDDLIQEGNIGLMRAAELYRPEKGTRFSTYASMWIIQCLSRAVDNKSRSIRLPVTMHQDIRSIRKAMDNFEKIHGTQPSESQISDMTELSPERVRTAIKSIPTTSSLNQPARTDGSAEIGDYAVDEKSSDFETRLERELEILRLEQLLDCLTEDEQAIMIHRFGLFGKEIYTYQAIADSLGTTISGVKHSVYRSVKKMKAMKDSLACPVQSEPGRGKYSI